MATRGSWLPSLAAALAFAIVVAPVSAASSGPTTNGGSATAPVVTADLTESSGTALPATPTPAEGEAAIAGAALSAAAPIPLGTPLSTEVYGWNWASPDSVYPYAISGDRIGVVTPGQEKFTAAVYSTATGKQVGSATTVSVSGWPIWGGFYAAPDGNFYVAAGRSNSNESDNFDTAIVRKYNSNWKLQGTATIKGGWSHGIKGIYEPFDAGAADMVLVGKRLVVHFPRLMYQTSDGLHHQSNFTVEVDTQSMSAASFESLGSTVYSSHSFNQFVTTNGSDLVFVDHGDAYPRSIQMGVMRNYPASRSTSTYDLLTFAGSIGDNYTGARVTDVISGPQGVVVLGNTRPNPGSESSFSNVGPEVGHDGFAIAANPKTGAHTFRSLTSVPKSSDVRGPRAVQIGADQFAVIYAVDANANSYSKRTSQLVYSVMDSSGKVLSTTRFGGIDFAASMAPVRAGDAVYVGVTVPGSSGSDDSVLMAIDIQNPGDSEMPVCPPGPFPDVTAANLHCTNIAWLSTTGITQPIGGKYLPTNPVTRGSMATFLHRLVHPGQAIPRCTAKPFPDVPVDYVHCGAIQWAAATGITVGYPDGNYKPENPVTRGSMSTFLYRIAGSPDTPKCTAKPFTDVPTNYVHCKTITWAKTDGITTGLSGGTAYGPEQTVHRDQMASFLHRIHTYLN